MKQITFYFDFISPYAYLAFERLPQALMGLSYSVSYRPVLFAAMLKQHGQLGPAEIASKRLWTYRQCAWLAKQQGAPFVFPQNHPFNPLALLRLAYASAAQGRLPNRYVCETIFRHAWATGLDVADPAQQAELVANLAPPQDPASDAVKALLKLHTDAAIAQQCFGVPSLVVDDKVFWGQDALPMLRDYLDGADWFQNGAWDLASQVGAGVQRIPKTP